MAKRSEIQAQIEALNAELEGAEDDDDEYEVWMRNDKGQETRVPGSRAAGWLKDNFGISLKDEAPPAGGEGGEGGEGGPKDPKPKAGGYFSKRQG